MLLHCAIVEDAVVDARKLACSLQTATEGKHELSVSFFESGDALLKSHSPADYDVAFLDICMPGTNGIETARQLRELSPSLPLIFITSSGNHVWQALSIHPFDYLLKPYSEATISKLLSDLLRTIRHVEREVEVCSERKALHIPLNKIHYILAQDYVVYVVTDEGEYRAASKFSQMQDDLCEEPRFLACNRGVIFNMDKVLRVEGDSIEMLCGKAFPVRQRDKRRLFNAFTQYQFRHMRKEV